MAVTRMLLSENFRVVIHDSSVDALNDFVAELGPAAKRDVCYPICFDPSNSEAVTAAVARIDADAWPVYVLINNSGILSNTLVEETSIDEWRNVFAQNVDSAFLLSRALLPAMRKRKWGRIVNTCSLAGKTGGVTTGVAYSTTKGALQTLTFALARESAKDGITVNGIAPAYIRTPTVETYPEDVVDMLLRYIPVSRFCEPEEFAHVVRFLISPMSGFITGEIIGTLCERGWLVVLATALASLPWVWGDGGEEIVRLVSMRHVFLHAPFVLHADAAVLCLSGIPCDLSCTFCYSLHAFYRPKRWSPHELAQPLPFGNACRSTVLHFFFVLLFRSNVVDHLPPPAVVSMRRSPTPAARDASSICLVRLVLRPLSTRWEGCDGILSAVAAVGVGAVLFLQCARGLEWCLERPAPVALGCCVGGHLAVPWRLSSWV